MFICVKGTVKKWGPGGSKPTSDSCNSRGTFFLPCCILCKSCLPDLSVDSSLDGCEREGVEMGKPVPTLFHLQDLNCGISSNLEDIRKK